MRYVAVAAAPSIDRNGPDGRPVLGKGRTGEVGEPSCFNKLVRRLASNQRSPALTASFRADETADLLGAQSATCMLAPPQTLGLVITASY